MCASARQPSGFATVNPGSVPHQLHPLRAPLGSRIVGTEVIDLPSELAVAPLEDGDAVVNAVVRIAESAFDDPVVALAADAPDLDPRRSARIVAGDVEAGLATAQALPGLWPILDEVVVDDCGERFL